MYIYLTCPPVSNILNYTKINRMITVFKVKMKLSQKGYVFLQSKKETLMLLLLSILLRKHSVIAFMVNSRLDKLKYSQ